MGRTSKLTWQPGAAGRGGRWRKLYRKKAYYFDGGRGCSDREAYRLAVAAWEELKAKLDSQAPKEHQSEYEAAIAEWASLLTWSTQRGDDEHAALARTKLRDLQRRLTRPKLSPMTSDDRFLARFEEQPVVDLDLEKLIPWLRKPTDLTAATVRDPTSSAHLRQFNNSNPHQVELAVWTDRLNGQPDQPPSNKSVAAHIEQLLLQKQAQVSVGKLSAARYNSLSLHLDAFGDFVGKATDVNALKGGTLTGFMTDLLKRVAKDEISRNYAKDRLDGAKLFIRWCWRTGAIENLPRDLGSPELQVGRETTEIRPYSLDEIKKFVSKATDRTKLYVLLALNTGATQVDIADLKHSEVDWDAGTITRKRSKTERHKSVPMVTWTLWPETLKLLKAERSNVGELVLVNESGSPLKVEWLEDGHIKKNDNIRNAFNRLCRKVELKGGEFKRFRKTSATMLRKDKDHSHVVDLFLGHAPQSIANRFYARAPQEQLDEAIKWLGVQYGILPRDVVAEKTDA